MDIKLKPGQLIKLVTKGLMYTKDGFAAGGNDGHGGFTIFETIRLSTYPSSNDFIGRSLKVSHGDLGILIDYIGRPHNVKLDPDWFYYDVYSILVCGNVMQVFKQNIELVN
tara:strand:+ start:247 stop:579 length:333 start_codon:yes stop_codon:yes gene_type:complete